MLEKIIQDIQCHHSMFRVVASPDLKYSLHFLRWDSFLRDTKKTFSRKFTALYLVRSLHTTSSLCKTDACGVVPACTCGFDGYISCYPPPPVLADNLKSNPGIKWQYFSSEEGIFTVFPAHKFRCKGSYEHRSRYVHLLAKVLIAV